MITTAQPPAILDRPQPLGFLPTRRFWTDPGNRRVLRIPLMVLAGVVVFAIGVIELPWWAAGLAAMTTVILIQGLFERYIRRQAMRRFRPTAAKPLPSQNPD